MADMRVIPKLSTVRIVGLDTSIHEETPAKDRGFFAKREEG